MSMPKNYSCDGCTFTVHGVIQCAYCRAADSLLRALRRAYPKRTP